VCITLVLSLNGYHAVKMVVEVLPDGGSVIELPPTLCVCRCVCVCVCVCVSVLCAFVSCVVCAAPAVTI
jgi:hypothetical protein